MGALSALSVQSNDLHAGGGKALTKGLKGNTVITELDISSNYLGLDSDYEPDMSGVIALADAIPDMRALLELIFGGDSYYVEERGESITPEPAVLEVGMSEADFSNRNLGPQVELSSSLPGSSTRIGGHYRC
jgi:hypothetical protein